MRLTPKIASINLFPPVIIELSASVGNLTRDDWLFTIMKVPMMEFETSMPNSGVILERLSSNSSNMTMSSEISNYGSKRPTAVAMDFEVVAVFWSNSGLFEVFVFSD